MHFIVFLAKLQNTMSLISVLLITKNLYYNLFRFTKSSDCSRCASPAGPRIIYVVALCFYLRQSMAKSMD